MARGPLNPNSPWHNKAWLHDRYVKRGKSIEKIAEECKELGFPTTTQTIYVNLKKHNLLQDARTLRRSNGGRGGKKQGFYD